MSTTNDRPLHVLFLNTQSVLRADVSVHASLARALDRRAVRVSAATNVYELPGDSARQAFESIPELTLLPLDLGRPMSVQRGLGRAQAILFNIRAIKTLVSIAAWCRKQRVDIVHVTERPRDALFGLILARLARCACLIHAHTSYYTHGRSLTDDIGDWTLRHADALVGVSGFTAATLWQAGPVLKERVFAVHNAVDTAILQSRLPPDARLAIRHQFGIAADASVVGAVGRLMPGKDQDSLVNAFAWVRQARPDARLIIAGVAADIAPDGLGGNYRDYLERRVAALGLNKSVVFTGYLPHETMAQLYAAFDLFAHPCVEEPFGLVLVEAMVRLLPVVAVNGGGVPEIIRDGVDGLLVPPRDPAAFARRIIELLADSARAQALARAGRARVLAAFTPEVQAAAMVAVYQQVVKRRRCSGASTRPCTGARDGLSGN
jgi:glycosyltransferase involved in cell wall biosynthesis